MATDRRHTRHVLARSAFALLCLIGLLAPAWMPSARADGLDDRVRAIGKELRCPVCAGETVADSNAMVAVQMRGVIRQKLEAGETPDQIKAYFVARYGPEILLVPQTSGFTLGVWIMPVVALLIGLGIVFAVLRSWSRRGEDDAPPPSAPETGAPSLSEGDDARLEEELARFREGRAGGDRVAG
jgi:cytochrome c-type biogenesis protein CcmH